MNGAAEPIRRLAQRIECVRDNYLGFWVGQRFERCDRNTSHRFTRRKGAEL
jgi:hypothetical protein